MRINRALAKLGYGSRRSVEELVRAGKVKVNGAVVTDLAMQVDPERDRIAVAGRKAPRRSRSPHVSAFYKPRGVLCTWKDERGRECLANYFKTRGAERVFAVGRLDRDSEGLLLITNDGELAHRLMHPSFEVPRTYEAAVSPQPDPDALKRLSGITKLADGPVQPQDVKLRVGKGAKSAVMVMLTEGRNRLVRRLFAAHGFEVLRLRRVQFGDVSLGRLRPGESRVLSSAETGHLRAVTAQPRHPKKPAVL
jgi:23S rRNA pseudouridine2605 synthase